MKRIYYTTAYDTMEKICGYVIPKEKTNKGYRITAEQYRRVLKNLTIGGAAGPIFQADDDVYVED